jgi:hypothetical protein
MLIINVWEKCTCSIHMKFWGKIKEKKEKMTPKKTEIMGNKN